MTNISIDENESLTTKHLSWLGFKNKNGAWIRKGFGEIQFYDKKFHYCEENKIPKLLKTNKDLNDIVFKCDYL